MRPSICAARGYQLDQPRPSLPYYARHDLKACRWSVGRNNMPAKPDQSRRFRRPRISAKEKNASASMVSDVGEVEEQTPPVQVLTRLPVAGQGAPAGYGVGAESPLLRAHEPLVP